MEEFDAIEEPLDTSKLSVSTALPAFRYKSSSPLPITVTPSSLSSSTSLSAVLDTSSTRTKRRKEKKSKSQRRRERRRRRRKNKKDKKFVRKPGPEVPITNYRGFTIERVSTGGSKKRLKWGTNNNKPPPFDMLLTSVEEAYPHMSAEERGHDEYEYIVNYDDYNVDDIHQGLSYSDLPSSKSRSQPPPLHESEETPSSLSSKHLLHLSNNPSKRNYKRRRHVM